MQDGSLIAAVDLGSNSFRMEVARIEHGGFVRIDYLKEPVRQGAGLDDQRNLTPQAMQRGWETLARFGERLTGFSRTHVRAVATQTLREAHNRDQFLKRGNLLLGFPIDVIAGREEARLIHQGVAHALGSRAGKCLVIDIGGRSTELILGDGAEAVAMESYRVGSVAWADKYFPDGKISDNAFERAVVAAKAVLDESAVKFSLGWNAVYGSAGTIGAVADILQAHGLSDGQRSVSSQGLQWVRAQLIAAGHVKHLALEGLKEDRKSVFASGLSVLIALMELLQLPQITAVDAGLRHGLLVEMLDDGQLISDVRAQAIERLARRFDVDQAQASRVGEVANALFAQLMQARSAESEEAHRHGRKLEWAANLHELGALISHSDCHKHGAYIIDHADVPGFSQTELHRLSCLVLGHKGKLRKLEAELDEPGFVQQLMCLRLAVILCHARVSPSLRGIALSSDRALQQFRLNLPSGWGQRFPQSFHLLAQEVLAWEKTFWTLQLS